MAPDAGFAEEPSFLDVIGAVERRYLDRRLAGDEFLLLALCFYAPPDGMTKEDYLMKTMGEDTYRTLLDKILDRRYCPSCDSRLLIAPTLAGDGSEVVCGKCGYVEGDYTNYEEMSNTLQSTLAFAGISASTFSENYSGAVKRLTERKKPTNATDALAYKWLAKNEEFIKKTASSLSIYEAKKKERDKNLPDYFGAYTDVSHAVDEERYGMLVDYFIAAKKDIISDTKASREPSIPVGV